MQSGTISAEKCLLRGRNVDLAQVFSCKVDASMRIAMALVPAPLLAPQGYSHVCRAASQRRPHPERHGMFSCTLPPREAYGSESAAASGGERAQAEEEEEANIDAKRARRPTLTLSVTARVSNGGRTINRIRTIKRRRRTATGMKSLLLLMHVRDRRPH